MQEVLACEMVDGEAVNCKPTGTIRDCNTQRCSYWGEWGDWGDCSVTCKLGIQTRRRICLGGDECGDNDEEIKECDTEIPGCWDWTAWAAWSPCDVSCGEGTKTTSRRCEAPELPYELTKDQCIGEATKTDRCTVEGQFYTCPRKYFFIRVSYIRYFQENLLCVMQNHTQNIS